MTTKVILISHITCRSGYTVAQFLLANMKQFKCAHISMFDPFHRVLAPLISCTFEGARQPEAMALSVKPLAIVTSELADSVGYSSKNNDLYANVVSTFAEAAHGSYYDMVGSLACIEIERLASKEGVQIVLITDVKMKSDIETVRKKYPAALHAHLDVSMIPDDIRSNDLAQSVFEHNIPKTLQQEGVADVLIPSSEKKPRPKAPRASLKCMTLAEFAAHIIAL